ncbi:hypothetical protein KJ652_07185 [Patescibacteria group bacterium]|nr:hypothetical protein [Patescibacteria group bacterium]MBU1124333.1 hypothetical protein [Patescibacteria group bacterium]MBU1911260.1 hypothetical protein [Patescibacteria group bacterium]
MLNVLKNESVREAFSWATSKTATNPQKGHYCSSRDILDARLEHLRKEILLSGTNEDTSYLLHAILSEICGNSFDHNLGQWHDIPGCLLTSEKLDNYFVITVADRGQGVLKTLQRVFPEITTHDEALKAAFLRHISGRAPERRGNGLKFVRKTLLEDGIDLVFTSGSARYCIFGITEEWSKAETSVPGCIAIVSFPLT